MINKSILVKGTIALIFLFLFSCSNEPLDGTTTASELTGATTLIGNKGANTYFGPQIKLGKGHVRSWIRISKDNKPEEIGVEMSAKFLDGLSPDEPASLVLPLHQKAHEVTPFDHVYFDWNPHGHEPEGVFTVPHFDAHFVMTSVADREAIPVYEGAEALFDNLPPADYLPADYFTPPFGGTAVPKMGSHWLPIALGDFLPFSNILLYGTFDGVVTFVEPMDTWDFLNSKATFSSSFSQPLKFQKTSNYPTVYNIYFDSKSKRHYISLSEFVPRTAD